MQTYKSEAQLETLEYSLRQTGTEKVMKGGQMGGVRGID